MAKVVNEVMSKANMGKSLGNRIFAFHLQNPSILTSKGKVFC